MQVQFELDDAHAQRLLQRQQQLRKPLPDIVAELVIRALDRPTEDPSPLYRAFAEANLLGCIDSSGSWPSDAKTALDFSDKCGEQS